MADTDYLAASDGTGNAALMHITSPRTALATVIQVDTVSGVPAFFIGTWGTLGADGFITAASARDFFGHVNAGTLVIDKMAPGNTDAGNTSGQVVVIKPSTQAQNLIGNFVKTATNLFGEGQLLNGKIVPTISSNNLVLSLKTLNGVDPSTTDVVYVRIGDTVRSITAALSVTLAAGTNWFSKGTAPLATVATNFFVYLGYNATDGVTIGVASSAAAYTYSDFSTTSTDYTYAKISNVAHAAATDVYENVGRFNAILGVTATFLWTLPAGNYAISQPSRNMPQYNARFSVYRNSAYTTSGAWPGTAAVVFDTKIFDFGNNFATGTGLFTAPVTGLYQFNTTMGASISSGVGHGVNFIKNGAALGVGTGGVSAATTFGYNDADATVMLLVAGDTVGVNHYASANAGAVGINANGFSGHLINAI